MRRWVQYSSLINDTAGDRLEHKQCEGYNYLKFANGVTCGGTVGNPRFVQYIEEQGEGWTWQRDQNIGDVTVELPSLSE